MHIILQPAVTFRRATRQVSVVCVALWSASGYCVRQWAVTTVSEEPAASISRYKMEAAGSSGKCVTTYKPK